MKSHCCVILKLLVLESQTFQSLCLLSLEGQWGWRRERIEVGGSQRRGWGELTFQSQQSSIDHKKQNVGCIDDVCIVLLSKENSCQVHLKTKFLIWFLGSCHYRSRLLEKKKCTHTFSKDWCSLRWCLWKLYYIFWDCMYLKAARNFWHNCRTHEI